MMDVERGKRRTWIEMFSFAVEPEQEVPFHPSVTCESSIKRVRKGQFSTKKSMPEAGVRESDV
jgi:hypothetical protein